MICDVCGNTRFTKMDVLWKDLIRQWQLSPTEVDYINRQQGETCDICHSNLRSIALAKSIKSITNTKKPLQEAISSYQKSNFTVLELNEAGNLSQFLRLFKHYTFGAYPDVDIHALPYNDEHFDLMVHSDTLEHVNNPIHALTECRRVLKSGGVLCCTVPIIVGRLSRSREGLEKSYHGEASTTKMDLLVHTEFGADT